MRLIICEKDNAAKRISDILSHGHYKVEKRGKVPVYDFAWNKKQTKTIGLRGHILNMDFPKKYNNWSAVSPKELIDVDPARMVSAKSIASVLRTLSKEAEEIYVATDFDREGELIGKEAVVYAVGEDGLDDVWRAHFSSLTKDEVTNSFQNPVRIDKALASAAETRQVLDLVWGATLTRFISLASDRLGHDFLSVGRVQSPTLALIVDKEKEIKAFKPVPYFRIESQNEKDSLEFGSFHSAGDIFDRKKAESIFEKVQGKKIATVHDVKERERTDKQPVPFNTTQFIKAANTMGMAAARIMSIAEDLYTNGYISYPRTDNTVYPKGLDLRKAVEELNRGPFREHCEHILGKEKITATRGSKQTTDHPPIYPTAFATKEELGPERSKVYDLVVRRFLATLHDPCKVKVTSVKLDVNSEIFNANGSRVIIPGWRGVYHFSKVTETELPEMKKGDTVNILKLSFLEKETKPPKRYSQGGLIQEMERLGLGTKSTRHEIIQKLYSRRYIEDSPPKPTLSGYALIESLEKHARMITDPDMTSRLEEDMEKISKSSLTQKEVIQESRNMLRDIMVVMEENKAAIGNEIKEALLEQDIAGKCPRCNNDLLTVRSKRGKRYVRCSKFPNCSKSYPLPQRGKIDFTDEICETCRSPMIILYRKGGRPNTLCMNINCPSKKTQEDGNDKGNANDGEGSGK
jgi:DNA topoisomerase-1